MNPDFAAKRTYKSSRVTTYGAEVFWGPFADLLSSDSHGQMMQHTREQIRATVADFLTTRATNNLKEVLALSKQVKGRVLCLGAELSIILPAVAENGYEATGLDPSEVHLEAVRKHLASLPENVQGRIQVVCEDFGYSGFEKTFSLVVLPFFVFTAPDDGEKREALLQGIASQLAVNGILVLEHKVYKQAQTGFVIDTDLCIDGKTMPGKIGWKLSDDERYLVINSSRQMLQPDGSTQNYLDAIQIELVTEREVEAMLSAAGLVIIDRQSSEEYGVEHNWMYCRRRADVSYPLWHPFTPMNGMEQMVTVFVDGKGSKVRDKNGKEYIDASGGLWNTFCGLGEPEIIQAITDQLHRLSYGTLFAWRGNEPALELARELVAMSPSPLQWAYLTGSGSESVELSIKIARLWSRLQGRQSDEIIYLDESFHGTFFGSLSLSGSTTSREMLSPTLPGVVAIPTPNSLRCPADKSHVDFALSCAQALEERAALGKVAAFIVEPVLGSAGVVIPPPEYFQRIEDICRKYHVLLMLDEVATGFGRTGKWFAAEHFNIRPDVMLLSKGMNSGYLPLGAVLFSAEIGQTLMKRSSSLLHGSTYNGHPACCSAALANIKLIRRKGLVQRAEECGKYFLERLKSLEGDPSVKEIRAIGLMLAVVLQQEDGTPIVPMQLFRLFVSLQKEGILSYMGLSTLTFCPALVITKEEIDTVVERLQKVLHSIRLRNGTVEPLQSNN